MAIWIYWIIAILVVGAIIGITLYFVVFKNADAGGDAKSPSNWRGVAQLKSTGKWQAIETKFSNTLQFGYLPNIMYRPSLVPGSYFSTPVSSRPLPSSYTVFDTSDQAMTFSHLGDLANVVANGGNWPADYNGDFSYNYPANNLFQNFIQNTT